MKNIGRIFRKKFSRMDQQAGKRQKKRVLGPGRRTREEIVKWNQMTALRFQTGGDIRHPPPPFGESEKANDQSLQIFYHSTLSLKCLCVSIGAIPPSGLCRILRCTTNKNCCDSPFLDALDAPAFQKEAVFLHAAPSPFQRLRFLDAMRTVREEQNVNAGWDTISPHQINPLSELRSTQTLQSTGRKRCL